MTYLLDIPSNIKQKIASTKLWDDQSTLKHFKVNGPESHRRVCETRSAQASLTDPKSRCDLAVLLRIYGTHSCWVTHFPSFHHHHTNSRCHHLEPGLSGHSSPSPHHGLLPSFLTLQKQAEHTVLPVCIAFHWLSTLETKGHVLAWCWNQVWWPFPTSFLPSLSVLRLQALSSLCTTCASSSQLRPPSLLSFSPGTIILPSQPSPKSQSPRKLPFRLFTFSSVSPPQGHF